MRAETLALGLGIAGLLVAATLALRPAPLPLPRTGPEHAQFPPAPRMRMATGRSGLPVVLALDGEIARMGRAAPRLEPLRRAFLDAPNLTQFAMDRLPRAIAGDGASQYFIYLALEQCRGYLRRDLESARLNLENMLNVQDLAGEERVAWRNEYERCRGFGLGGWDAIGQALGAEEPGSEAEYASLWFERAGQAGYPTALAELALRPSPIGAPEREAMLRDALASGGPDVYWLLFAHSADVPSGEASVPSLAWLIVACRSGQDCSEQARWYRGFACLQGYGCTEGRSALEHYWFSAPVRERDQAWILAARMEVALRAGQWDELPFPDLERLDYRRLWEPAKR
ncbi:MAG: hypothetical protein ACT4PK_07850 [Gammaproteobacteria bacterium]